MTPPSSTASAPSSPTTLTDAVRHLAEVEREERKDRDTQPLERQLRGGLGRYWRAQRDALMPMLDDLRGHFQEAAGDDFERLWAAVENIDDGELADLVDDLAATSMQRGAVSAGLDVGLSLSLNVEAPQVVRHLRNRGARLVANVDDTTRNLLRTIIADGVENGRTYAQVGRDISTRFTGFSNRSTLGHVRTRAELVAVTEIGEAYSASHDLLADDLTASGLAVERRWIVTPDQKLCPTCAPNDIGWIAYGEEFPSGHIRPLAHPGCRCDTTERAAGARAEHLGDSFLV